MGSNMLLTIGSIVIFGVFLASANRLMIGNNQIAAQNEYYIAGLSLAQSLLDEAKTKAYDKQTVNGAVGSSSAFTAAASLGPEGAGEVVPNPDTLTSAAPYTSSNRGYLSTVRFDDLDDYNGYNRLVNTPRAEGYRLSVRVNYTSATNPDSLSAAKSYCKTMTVKVTSPYFPQSGQSNAPDTLSVSYAFAY